MFFLAFLEIQQIARMECNAIREIVTQTIPYCALLHAGYLLKLFNLDFQRFKAHRMNHGKPEIVRILFKNIHFAIEVAILGLSGFTITACLAGDNNTSISSIGTASNKTSFPKTNAPVKQALFSNFNWIGPT